MHIGDLVVDIERDLGPNATITRTSRGTGCYSLEILTPNHASYWEIDGLRRTATLERQETPGAIVGTHILPWMKRHGYRPVGASITDMIALEQPRYITGITGTRHEDFVDILPSSATIIIAHYIPHKERAIAVQDLGGTPITLGRAYEEEQRAIILSSNTIHADPWNILPKLAARAEKLVRDVHWTHIECAEDLGCITQPTQ